MPTLPQASLTLTHIVQRYSRARPFLKIPKSLFPKNSNIALLGGNGAGKSTILRLISRKQHFTEGEIEIVAAPARPQLGYTPQGNQLWESITLK